MFAAARTREIALRRNETMTSAIHGGAAVHGGYYFNPARWSIEVVERDGMRLPEGKGTWRRVPAAAALALTPILGAMFLVALPFIGFGCMVHALARSAREAVMAYTSGREVRSGYYWCPRSWKVEVIPPEGGRLPGPGGARYVKVPFPLLFVVVPLLGALFLMFLPLIGFGLVAHAVVLRLSGGVRKSADDLASTLTPGWRPGEAHFTGKAGEDLPSTESKVTKEIEELEREIEEKRNRK
jgi:hypothetical protein